MGREEDYRRHLSTQHLFDSQSDGIVHPLIVQELGALGLGVAAYAGEEVKSGEDVVLNLQ